MNTLKKTDEKQIRNKNIAIYNRELDILINIQTVAHQLVQWLRRMLVYLQIFHSLMYY